VYVIRISRDVYIHIYICMYICIYTQQYALKTMSGTDISATNELFSLKRTHIHTHNAQTNAMTRDGTFWLVHTQDIERAAAYTLSNSQVFRFLSLSKRWRFASTMLSLAPPPHKTLYHSSSVLLGSLQINKKHLYSPDKWNVILQRMVQWKITIL